jgi:hypothetical protein
MESDYWLGCRRLHRIASLSARNPIHNHFGAIDPVVARIPEMPIEIVDWAYRQCLPSHKAWVPIGTSRNALLLLPGKLDDAI